MEYGEINLDHVNDMVVEVAPSYCEDEMMLYRYKDFQFGLVHLLILFSPQTIPLCNTLGSDNSNKVSSSKYYRALS